MKARTLESPWFPLLALLVGFVGYSWVLNNGFISDDLVFLDQSRGLAFLRAHLHSAPSAFRLTADLWFGGVQALFGYHASGFYVFSIGLHTLNALLLRAVLLRRGADPSVAGLASLLFVVIESPAEAVAWLSAVNELLMAFFVLACLLAAQNRRYGASLVLFCAALVSKESGIVLVLLLPLLIVQIGFYSGRTLQSPVARPFLGRAQKPSPAPDFGESGHFTKWFWMGLLGISLAYLIWFATLMRTNFLIQSHFYSFSPRAVLVLINSLHRLAFPWIYLALLIAFRSIWKGAERREAVITVAWLVLSLCPYIFLIYDTHVPSRHLYLAAMPGCYLIAQLVWPLGKSLRWTFVIAFAVVNIGYLWMIKDHQYVVRGRTIHDLVSILGSHRPGCAVVKDFPENPWIAKLSAPFVPGWSPDMIKVNELKAVGSPCLTIRWDAKQKRYEIIREN